MQKIGFIILLALSITVNAQKSQIYELRIYHCENGKLPNLMERFRNHTLALFEKHGMENIAYFEDLSNPNDLVYVLGFPSKEAKDSSWKHFVNDPVWKDVRAKSEENGKIIASIESKMMTLITDLTPKIKLRNNYHGGIYEMRTYFCLPGKYPNLVARFKNHTLKIFKNHGMKNLMYFETLEDQPKLLYFLSHKNTDAAKTAWDAFRKDPDWINARDESEKNGKIVEKVESIYLKGADFSKFK